jgi:hypothetical protein
MQDILQREVAARQHARCASRLTIQGRHTDAIASYTTALELSPGGPQVSLKLAQQSACSCSPSRLVAAGAVGAHACARDVKVRAKTAGVHASLLSRHCRSCIHDRWRWHTAQAHLHYANRAGLLCKVGDYAAARQDAAACIRLQPTYAKVTNSATTCGLQW